MLSSSPNSASFFDILSLYSSLPLPIYIFSGSRTPFPVIHTRSVMRLFFSVSTQTIAFSQYSVSGRNVKSFCDGFMCMICIPSLCVFCGTAYWRSSFYISFRLSLKKSIILLSWLASSGLSMMMSVSSSLIFTVPPSASMIGMMPR